MFKKIFYCLCTFVQVKTNNIDEYFMQQALKEARKAFEKKEVPIGAVIVIKDKIISRSYNQVEKLNDSTAHAEIIALTSAYNYLGSKYLPEATLYITIEPCIMCAGALYWSKIGSVIYGAADEKHGAIHSIKNPNNNEPQKNIFHPKTKVTGGICAVECGLLMKDFFKVRR